jgi:hypothetical protein
LNLSNATVAPTIVVVVVGGDDDVDDVDASVGDVAPIAVVEANVAATTSAIAIVVVIR